MDIFQNRLEVYLGKVIVSLERAYHIFLNHGDSTENSNKLTKEEYVVYSHFMRFGCNLRRFKTEMLPESTSKPKNHNEASKKMDTKSYVWQYLHELLGYHGTINTLKNLDQNQYDEIKSSMNRIIDGFQSGSVTSTNCNDSTTGSSGKIPEKRKPTIDNVDRDEPALKVTKLCDNNEPDDQYFGSGATNDFMIDGAFQRFRQIFDQINVIDLKTTDFNNKRQSTTNERFSFDLWTSSDIRQSHHRRGPNYRLIVK